MSSLHTVPTQKSYGLIKKSVPPSKKNLSNIKSNYQGFFANDDDDLNDSIQGVNKKLIRSASKIDKDVEKVHASAMAEDPNIFDYDGSYDHFKASHASSHPLSKAAPTSRYVSSILAASKIKEKEQDRIYERKLLKERKVEDEIYGDTPKFVTSAYKKRLADDRKWEYEDKLAEQIEAKTDVRGRGMSGFYSNLLTKNITMGGDVQTSALSAYTTGSQRQTNIDDSKNIRGLDNLMNNNDDSNSQTLAKKLRTEDISCNSYGEEVLVQDDSEVTQVNIESAVSNISTAHVVIGTDESRAESNKDKNMPPPEIISREVAVASARERYLARKAAAEKKSDI